MACGVHPDIAAAVAGATERGEREGGHFRETRGESGVGDGAGPMAS